MSEPIRVASLAAIGEILQKHSDEQAKVVYRLPETRVDNT